MSDIKNTYGTQLTSHWKLEETSGTRVDSHGSNDLTDNNTVTSRAGIQGTAASLDRTTSEYLSIADNASLSIVGDFSISMWVKPDDDISARTTAQALISKAASPSNWSWLFDVQGTSGSPAGQIRFWYSSSGAFPGSAANRVIALSTTAMFTAADVGNWVHVVVTVDVSTQTVIFYKNGSALTTSASGSAATIYDSTATFEVGNWSGGSYYFDGGLDEISIWNGRILSASEVSDIYNSGAGIPYEATTPSVTPNALFFGAGL